MTDLNKFNGEAQNLTPQIQDIVDKTLDGSDIDLSGPIAILAQRLDSALNQNPNISANDIAEILHASVPHPDMQPENENYSDIDHFRTEDGQRDTRAIAANIVDAVAGRLGDAAGRTIRFRHTETGLALHIL